MSSSTGGAWVFGYGSLAAPASVARTIGRTIEEPHARRVAELAGYGRRWNYGSMHLRGDWIHDGVAVTGGVVVSLGLVEASSETCNGVIVRVSADELAALDWRERDYERTEVTDRITLELDAGGDLGGDLRFDVPVVTYVPRPSAVERYLAARDARRAAVRASYWELVHDSFALLGADHLERLRATPAPDVPVADITLTTD